MSKVYIKIDSSNRITAIDGGYTESNIIDPENWILIDEGDGDRYNLCQSHYLTGGLYTDGAICRWKWVNNECTLRSDAEIEAEIESDKTAIPTPHISEIEMLKKQIQAQNEILDFYEECIAEMAEVVYA